MRYALGEFGGFTLDARRQALLPDPGGREADLLAEGDRPRPGRPRRDRCAAARWRGSASCCAPRPEADARPRDARRARVVERMAAALPRHEATSCACCSKPRPTDTALRLIGEQRRRSSRAPQHRQRDDRPRRRARSTSSRATIEVELDGRALPGFSAGRPDRASCTPLVGNDIELEVLRHDPARRSPTSPLRHARGRAARARSRRAIPVPMLQVGVTDAPLLLPRRHPDVRLPAAASCRRTSSSTSWSTPPTSASRSTRCASAPRRSAARSSGTRDEDPRPRRDEVPRPRDASTPRSPRGHELTLFNRGQTNAELFPDVEHLRGDREGDLAALEGRELGRRRRPSGYLPADVRRRPSGCATRRPLRLRLERLRLRRLPTGPTESSAVAELGDLRRRATPDYSNYGALKALCEAEVEGVFGERALIVRPGLIVGPYDPTGRFTYWAHRRARGGECSRRARPSGWRSSSTSATSPTGSWRRRAGGLSGTFNATNEGVAGGAARRSDVHVGRRTSSCRSTRSGPGWSCRSGCRDPTTQACTTRTSAARSLPASASARSRRRSAGRRRCRPRRRRPRARARGRAARQRGAHDERRLPRPRGRPQRGRVRAPLPGRRARRRCRASPPSSRPSAAGE